MAMTNKEKQMDVMTEIKLNKYTVMNIWEQVQL